MADAAARPRVSTIQTVVEADLCSGCGVCAGTCPRGLLSMVTDARGCRVPTGYAACEKSCGVCEAACPFASAGPDEDALASVRFNAGVAHAPSPVGFAYAAWVGHVTDAHQRESSSSGGLCTWFLDALIADGRIDAVACVRPGAGERLFEYALVSEDDELDQTRGSRYYPVDLAEVLGRIRSEDRRVALVGLPCALKGVARAMARDRHLRERIVCLVGLTCGQMKSEAYTEYLARRAGLAAEPDTAQYRVKVPGRPAGEFRFVFGAGGDSRVIEWLGTPSALWTAHWFTVRACHFCDDLFAEVADVSFMDAWLEPYASEWRGTSIAVVRDPALASYFSAEAHSGDRTVEPIDIERVVASQSRALRDKREGLGWRLAQAARLHAPVPPKRAVPVGRATASERLRWWSQSYLADASFRAWASGADERAVSGTLNRLRYVTRLLDGLQRLMRRFGL